MSRHLGFGTRIPVLRADREAILGTREDRLKQGATFLVGNRGCRRYRRYLSAEGRGFRIDAKEIERDERYDGKWVLRSPPETKGPRVATATSRRQSVPRGSG